MELGGVVATWVTIGPLTTDRPSRLGWVRTVREFVLAYVMSHQEKKEIWTAVLYIEMRCGSRR
jgi:hypothetical protein